MNIFSIGDCSLNRVNEEKTVVPARMCAEICALNIKYLNEKNLYLLKKIPDKFPCVYGLTLGTEKGMFILNDYVKVNKKASDWKI